MGEARVRLINDVAARTCTVDVLSVVRCNLRLSRVLDGTKNTEGQLVVDQNAVP